jgi:excisionase family DNA binding protein
MSCYSTPTPTNETTSLLDSYYTVKEVADKLGVNHKLIRKLIQGGKLEANKVGGAIRISEGAVLNYLERNRIQKEESLPVKVAVKPNRGRRLHGGLKFL